MNVIEWNKLKRLSSSANRRPSRKSTAGIFQYNPTDVLFFFSHCGTKARDRCSHGELNPDCLTVDAVFVNNGATFSLEFSITFEKRITPWHAKRILAIATVVLSVLFDFFFVYILSLATASEFCSSSSSWLLENSTAPVLKSRLSIYSASSESKDGFQNLTVGRGSSECSLLKRWRYPVRF